VKSLRKRPPRRESKLSRVAAVVLGALIVVSVGVVASRHHKKGSPAGDTTSEAAASDGVARRPALPSLPAGSPVAAPSPSVAPPEPTSEQVASLIKSWHAAIVTKNAETVETLDREFAARPDQFVTALIENAQADPEERVRSFSTRVLGKLRRPQSLEALRRLLKDGSQFVRFNAAWALGELNDRDSAPTLLRLERHDPSLMVRQSAGESRRKIEGT